MSTSLKDRVSKSTQAVTVLYVKIKTRRSGAKPHVVIETAPDDASFPHFQIFHINDSISDRRYFAEDFRDGQLSSLLDRNPAPVAVSKFMTELHAINGVESVHLEKYQMTVHIGKAFYWHQIEPAVMQTIKRHLGWFGTVKIERREKHYSNCTHKVQ